MTEYYKYDPKTFAYVGAGIGENVPDNATITPITGLVSNIVYNPAANSWTGDRVQAPNNTAPQPTTSQLMMMSLTQEVSDLSAKVAALTAAINTTKGANA